MQATIKSTSAQLAMFWWDGGRGKNKHLKIKSGVKTLFLKIKRFVLIFYGFSKRKKILIASNNFVKNENELQQCVSKSIVNAALRLPHTNTFE